MSPTHSTLRTTISTQQQQLRELIRKQLVQAIACCPISPTTFDTTHSFSSSSSSTTTNQQNLLKTTLYSYPPSTCSWRVRAAMYHHLGLLSKFISSNSITTTGNANNSNNYEKYIKNQTVNIDLTSKMNEKDEYYQVNPMKQVPALEFQNQKLKILLTQSLPIIGFLDNLAEMIIHEERDILGHSLHPDYHFLIPRNDLYLNFRTNQLSEIVNSGIQPYQNIRLLRKIPKEVRGEDNKLWIGEWQRKGLNQIEDIISHEYGDYSVGELTQLANSKKEPLYFVRDYHKLSMADLFLVPSIEAAINRSDINMEKEFPYSFAIYSSLKDLDIFSQTRN